MPHATQVFCLLLPQEFTTDLPVQFTPEGRKYLVLSDVEWCAHRDGKLTRAQADDNYVQFATVQSGAHRLLLMNAVGHVRTTVNGLPAARYQVLQPGDVIRIEDDPLQVLILNRPYVGPPRESDLGSTCGYCRTPITNRPGARVYVCPVCQSPTHFDDSEVPEEVRLSCFAMSAHCTVCQAPLMEREGFSHDLAL